MDGVYIWIICRRHSVDSHRPYFVGATQNASVPTFIYYILASLAFFFLLFPLNMFLQYKKVGRRKDYLYGEYLYVILSIVEKTALAWQVFAGTLR